MTNIQYPFLVLIILLLVNQSFAQTTDSDSTKKKPIILTAFLYYRNSPLLVGEDEQKTAYVSNNRYVLKLGIVIRGLALRWGISLPAMVLNSNRSLSSYMDLHANYSKSPFIFDADFRRGRGFSKVSYSENLFRPTLSDKYRADMKIFDVAFLAAYTFSKDFDYNTAFKNLRPIEKNVLCPYLGFRSVYHHLRADSSFSPTAMPKLNTSNLSASVGFVAAASQKNWFIATIFGLGAGIQYQKGTDTKLNHLFVLVPVDIRTNIGYNSERYFLAFSTYIDNFLWGLPETNFHYNPYLCLSLNYGFRLKTKL